ncbi:MAG: TCR/Tet family MFS transporter [Trueperaceae bacterium]|nr:TCR/Tet family MFS transporter [Trueperaceae bacterium]
MPLRPGARAGIAFILVTLFLDILGIGIIIPVLPGLVTSFTGGDASAAAPWYAALAAVYAGMQFLFAPLIGALSDRFGRRKVILASLTAFGASYLILAVAPSLAWLFVGRVVAGITGATITAANAYIADVSTPETRARNFGFVGVAFGLGFVFGPAIGGLLGGIGLRVPFYAAAFVALLGALYGLFVLPESLPPENRRAFSWSRADPFRALLGLRAYPLVAGLAFAFLFFSLAQRGLETVFVLYTDYRYGWGPRENGLALALVGVMAAVVQGGLVRPLVARLGERRTIVAGLAVSMLGFVGYGLASQGWILLVVIAVASLGAVAGPAIQGLIAGTVSATEQGSVQGTLTSMLSLTSVVAPLVAGGLFGMFTGERSIVELPGMPFYAGAVFLVVALALVIRTLRRNPILAESDSSGVQASAAGGGTAAEPATLD